MTDPVVPRIGGTGPVDAALVPRYVGPATFARLPRLDEFPEARTVVWGVPFDSGVSYRPGARFGPSHVRESSRLLRPYNPALDIEPFARHAVADAGDVSANPFDIADAIATIEQAAGVLVGTGRRLLTIGGDHTIALPLLRVAHAQHGPIAVLHFDSTSTPGTPTSAPRTRTAHRFAARPRRASSTSRTRCTSACAGRSTARSTCARASGSASRLTSAGHPRRGRDDPQHRGQPGPARVVPGVRLPAGEGERVADAEPLGPAGEAHL